MNASKIKICETKIKNQTLIFHVEFIECRTYYCFDLFLFFAYLVFLIDAFLFSLAFLEHPERVNLSFAI